MKIGAIFTFDSVIGRVSKPAIELAVSDINEDPTILSGIKLSLIPEDSNCSVFMGAVEGTFSGFFLLLYFFLFFIFNL